MRPCGGGAHVGDGSVLGVQDVAQLGGECVRLAGPAVLAAEEAGVVAREDRRLGREPLGNPIGPRFAISPSDSAPAATTSRVEAARSASKSGS